MILRRTLLKGLAGSVAVALRAAPAAADDVLKMSVSIPLTGAGLNAVGPQLAGARSSFTLRNVVGRRIELTVRDDGGVADNARRIMQDMIVNRKVGLIGIGIMPTSLAIAPLVTEAKIQLSCLGHRHQVALHGEWAFGRLALNRRRRSRRASC